MSAAGTVVIQALQIMENFDPNSMDDEEWAAITGQALGIASPELRVLGTDTAAARATSKEWAATMATRVRAPGATNGRERGAFLPALNSLGDGRGHTTHVTTADRNGMFVALT